jgi:hypothetical protein
LASHHARQLHGGPITTSAGERRNPSSAGALDAPAPERRTQVPCTSSARFVKDVYIGARPACAGEQPREASLDRRYRFGEIDLEFRVKPMATCYRCKSDMVIVGALYSGMRTSFRPQDSKFLTLETGDVMTKATMCRNCGVVEIVGDVNKLRRLTSEPDAETEQFVRR